jgi:hypothetical protein
MGNSHRPLGFTVAVETIGPDKSPAELGAYSANKQKKLFDFVV